MCYNSTTYFEQSNRFKPTSCSDVKPHQDVTGFSRCAILRYYGKASLSSTLEMVRIPPDAEEKGPARRRLMDGYLCTYSTEKQCDKYTSLTQIREDRRGGDWGGGGAPHNIP